METRGLHLLADFWGCSFYPLKDVLFLEDVVREAARRAGGNLRKLDSHKFRPPVPPYSEGVTVYAILAESHISIHTFPEAGFAAIDIYTCGSRCKPCLGYEHMRERLRPASVSLSELVRGHRPSG